MAWCQSVQRRLSVIDGWPSEMIMWCLIDALWFRTRLSFDAAGVWRGVKRTRNHFSAWNPWQDWLGKEVGEGTEVATGLRVLTNAKTYRSITILRLINLGNLWPALSHPAFLSERKTQDGVYLLVRSPSKLVTASRWQSNSLGMLSERTEKTEKTGWQS